MNLLKVTKYEDTTRGHETFINLDAVIEITPDYVTSYGKGQQNLIEVYQLKMIDGSRIFIERSPSVKNIIEETDNTL